MAAMSLSPLVFWAQRHQEIYLRVELTDAQNIDVNVHEKVLQFSAQGQGAQGQNEYKFSLEFVLPVKPEVSYKFTQHQVNLTIQKEKQGWWERLTLHDSKTVFLAPDLLRWMEESNVDAELEDRAERRQRLRALRQTEGGFVNFRTGYLLVYNLVQFVCFSWLFVNMTVCLFYFGPATLSDTYRRVSAVMCSCQVLAILEGVHATLGIVRTSLIPTFIQMEERSFTLFIFGALEEMQKKPVVFFVFYLWSAIEIFRYPYYVLTCLNTEWKTLTWLRYTVWIPLSPLIFLAEATAVVQSVTLFDGTLPFSFPIMRVFGKGLKFSHFLYIYLCSMLLGLIINLRHLNKQRCLHCEKRKMK